jgi:hypothetical protein
MAPRPSGGASSDLRPTGLRDHSGATSSPIRIASRPARRAQPMLHHVASLAGAFTGWGSQASAPEPLSRPAVHRACGRAAREAKSRRRSCGSWPDAAGGRSQLRLHRQHDSQFLLSSEKRASSAAISPADTIPETRHPSSRSSDNRLTSTPAVGGQRSTAGFSLQAATIASLAPYAPKGHRHVNEFGAAERLNGRHVDLP